MNNKKIENLIYQYHWRKKELDRLSDLLWGLSNNNKSVGVVQYGIEATLPKPNTNIKSIPEMNDMDARERRNYERYIEYEEKVHAVESMIDCLGDEQHKIIIDCMMEGMSYRSIADHLSVNRNKIRDMKEEMLCQICQKCHLLQGLQVN